MLTRNFLIIPYPDITSNLRAIITLSGEGTIQGTLKILSIDKYLLPLNIGVKIGDKHAVFNCDDTTTPFIFNMVGDINAPIVIALGTQAQGKTITLGAVNTDNLTFDDSIYVEKEIANIKEDNSHLYTDYTQEEVDVGVASISETEPSFSLFENYLQDTNTLNSESKNIEKSPLLNMDNIVLGDNNFYNLISPQLNHLFSNYPRFTMLEKNIKNTEWIKVSYTDNGEGHYILGKLYDNGIVSHICYGIPSPSRLTPPPEQLTDYCQWLPLNLDDVDGEGYWVMYQSAETGENYRL